MEGLRLDQGRDENEKRTQLEKPHGDNDEENSLI